jgi:hypothetical protein
VIIQTEVVTAPRESVSVGRREGVGVLAGQGRRGHCAGTANWACECCGKGETRRGGPRSGDAQAAVRGRLRADTALRLKAKTRAKA